MLDWKSKMMAWKNKKSTSYFFKSLCKITLKIVGFDNTSNNVK